MLEWDDLRFFCAFARHGSLAAAARFLAVEHATVARRIASLEASLNMKLVDRRGRVYQLTADGERIAEYASKMETATFELQRFVAGEEDRIDGEVIVSAPPAFLGSLVAQRLGSLRLQYPGLRVKLVGAKSTASLSRKESDVAISFVRPLEQSVVAKNLGFLAFSLYASAEYLASTEPEDYEFIGYYETAQAMLQQEWLNAKLNGRTMVITSNDLRIQALAAAGHAGLVLLPDFLARDYALQKVAVDGPSLSVPIWLCFHKDMRASPKVRVVLDFLIAGLSEAQQM
jgi:DNA-binding transcriptional LysR family regulator